MDAPQASELKESKKKKKRKTTGQDHALDQIPQVSSHQNLLLPTVSANPKAEEFQSEDSKSHSEAEKPKRKRNRKRRLKKQVVGEAILCDTEEHEHEDNLEVAKFSASPLSAVEEALQFSQSSDKQMKISRPSDGTQISSSSVPNKNSEKKHPEDSSIESVVSPGARRLASENVSSTLKGKHSTLKPVSGNQSWPDCKVSQQSTLNSQDLDLIFAASTIGPIYSRSALCSTVTTTSSTLSSQLSCERIQNNHLYGNTPLLTSSHIASNSTCIEMNPPTVTKSREEVEAERKARKAAKQAAKGKGKENAQENCVPVPTKEAAVSSPKGKDKELSKETPPQPQGLKGKETTQNISTKTEKVPAKAEGVDKSKAELRAERRAKQEAQRAAKAQQQQDKQTTHQQGNQPQKPSQPPTKSLVKSGVKQELRPPSNVKALKEAKDTKADRRVKLFIHLYQNSFKNISQSIGVNHPLYHLAVVRLGVQYANRVVLGSNARCLALLYALKELIADYETPPQKEFSRGLESYLQPNMDFLQQCRPHSVSMVNALRHIKWQLTQLPINISDTEARQQLQDAIDQYINEQIGKAAEAIGKAVSNKIADEDVILVYACSSLVLSALKVALEEKRKFRVVVVDSLPWLEGREMLRRLVSMKVQCSYVHLSAASFVMRQVSKVLLGAHALLANGYVMSRAGSSQVALLAHSYNVPVLVCCETHKFSERVLTDSFVYNELGDPDELIGSRRAGEREGERERPLANWRNLPYLSLLNLVYDVTPPDLVTAVVTERAILPCTSVPVILRIKPPEC